MEAVDGLRVSCFLLGHVMWLRQDQFLRTPKSSRQHKKLARPSPFSSFLFFFLLHLPHITFKMAFGKLYGLPVCFSSSLCFDSRSNILKGQRSHPLHPGRC